MLSDRVDLIAYPNFTQILEGAFFAEQPRTKLEFQPAFHVHNHIDIFWKDVQTPKEMAKKNTKNCFKTIRSKTHFSQLNHYYSLHFISNIKTTLPKLLPQGNPKSGLDVGNSQIISVLKEDKERREKCEIPGKCVVSISCQLLISLFFL